MQKDGPPELTACDNCRLTDTDIKPHISGNYITPCPSYFEEFKIYDHRMEPVAEEAVCNACLSYMDHINVAIPVFGEITKVLENPYGADGIFGGPAGREKRAIIRHFWRVVASFSGIVGQVEQHQNIDVAAKDADTLAQYRAMLEHVVEPFRGLQMSDANRGILNTLFYNGVYERIAGFTHNLFGAFAIFEDYVKASVQAMTVDEPVAIDHKNFVAIQRNKILAMQAAQKIVMNPPEIVIDPNDPDINRDRVAALVRNILVQSGAVIVNTNDPSNVLVALPELKNGQFYYTYSPSMTISEALQRLKVDASVSHVYAKYMTDISRQIHTYHENSVLRLSRNDFVCKMVTGKIPKGAARPRITGPARPLASANRALVNAVRNARQSVPLLEYEQGSLATVPLPPRNSQTTPCRQGPNEKPERLLDHPQLAFTTMCSVQ